MRTYQPISFHINYFTQYGQSLFVAGNLWNNWQEFIPMTWLEGGRWELACSAPVRPADVIEYKYIVCDQSRSNILWESSGNRKLVVAADSRTAAPAGGKKRLTLVVNDVWDFPSQTSFAWKQEEVDPSTFFSTPNNNSNCVENVVNRMDEQKKFEDEIKRILKSEKEKEIKKKNESKNNKIEDDEEEEDDEDEDDEVIEVKKIVYESCPVDEERIRRINEQKRKKMIALRNSKARRRPPTVHVPSPLSQSTTY